MRTLKTLADTEIGDIFVAVEKVDSENGTSPLLLRGEGHDQVISIQTGLPVHWLATRDSVIIVRKVNKKQSSKSEDKKARLLMIVIERMIARYQNQHAGNLDEEIFKLFETAKKVKYADTERDFQNAIHDL